MHGETCQPAAVAPLNAADHEKSPTLQGATQRRLEELIMLYSGCDRALKAEDTLSSVLKGRNLYEASDCPTIATFEPSLVSLHDSVHDAASLSQLLPGTDRGILEGLRRRCCEVRATTQTY